MHIARLYRSTSILLAKTIMCVSEWCEYLYNLCRVTVLECHCLQSHDHNTVAAPIHKHDR